jgi:hypothetical protein
MKKVVILGILAALLVLGAVYLSSDDPFKTEGIEQSDFAISDTASVGKIIIADRSGRVIKLNRGEESWLLNGKYPARKDAVETLLRTFKNIYIQRTIAKESVEQISKVMASGAKKIQIFNLEGDPIKTWYVGHATMDKKGTYMLLETPRYGKSSVPYIMDMKGFIGMLNTRFFLDENEWRSTFLLKYPELNLSSIEVEYPTDEMASFKILYGGENDIRLFDGEDNEFTRFDTRMVKDYMLNYRKIAFENYKTGLSESQADSVKSLLPYQVVRITDDQGVHEIRLWAKKGLEEGSDVHLDSLGIDQTRVYADLNNGELALAQRYVWDNFRAPLQVFAPEK